MIIGIQRICILGTRRSFVIYFLSTELVFTLDVFSSHTFKVCFVSISWLAFKLLFGLADVWQFILFPACSLSSTNLSRVLDIVLLVASKNMLALQTDCVVLEYFSGRCLNDVRQWKCPIDRIRQMLWAARDCTVVYNKWLMNKTQIKMMNVWLV